MSLSKAYKKELLQALLLASVGAFCAFITAWCAEIKGAGTWSTKKLVSQMAAQSQIIGN